MRHLSVSAYAAILAAGLVGLVTGYVFGRVVARLVGFYLALTTFALALALPQMLKSSYVSPWTGGAQGLYLDRPGAPLRLPVTPDQWWYFVTLGILALLLWMTHNLIAGRIGRAIRAMRDDPIAALVMGIGARRAPSRFHRTRELHLLALDPLSGGLGVRRHDIGVGRRGRRTVPPVLARHRRHGVARPRLSGVRGAPHALDAVHAEWRRRDGVGVAMASNMGHAGAALTSTCQTYAPNSCPAETPRYQVRDFFAP